MRAHYGALPPRTAVIPNPGPRPPAVGWQAGASRRIVHVGRFERLKGSDVVLDAFAALAPRFPDVELAIVGPDLGMLRADGSLATFDEFLQARGYPAAVTARIRFHGALPTAEVAALRRTAAVTVVASRYENFPMTVLEAMADGCPLVATAVGGIPEMARDGWKVGSKIPGRVLHARYSRYMQRVATVAPALVDQLALVGARFTHHTSIAPTGTISLSLANNASNGIEPSFAHHYFRNVIREGKKSKEKVDVFSFELLAYRELINSKAMPNSTNPAEKLPDYFTTADDITPTEHVDIQAASQKWIDSSISKTANVPTDFKYESFKDIYLYAHEKGLKGCTTFRFNPEAFQGVLVKEEDLKNTTYVFTLEDGSEVSVKGDEEIEYDGEKHTAANLYDALKEGYYGKF